MASKLLTIVLGKDDAKLHSYFIYDYYFFISVTVVAYIAINQCVLSRFTGKTKALLDQIEPVFASILISTLLILFISNNDTNISSFNLNDATCASQSHLLISFIIPVESILFKVCTVINCISFFFFIHHYIIPKYERKKYYMVMFNILLIALINISILLIFMGMLFSGKLKYFSKGVLFSSFLIWVPAINFVVQIITYMILETSLRGCECIKRKVREMAASNLDEFK